MSEGRKTARRDEGRVSYGLPAGALRKRATVCLLVLSLLGGLRPSRALQPLSTDRRAWRVGSTGLFGGALSEEFIYAAGRQYVRVIVEKDAAPLRLLVSGPDGAPLLEAFLRRPGVTEVAFLTSQAGAHQIALDSGAHAGGAGRPRLNVAEVRDETPSDSADLQAQADFLAAERLRENWDEDSLRLAISRYESARVRWREASHLSRAIEALLASSELSFYLGAYGDALSAATLAARESRSAGDRPRELESLVRMGQYRVALGENRMALEDLRQALVTYESPETEMRPAVRLAGRARAANYIGEAYYSMGELNEAESYFRRALDWSAQAEDRANQALAELNLGYTLNDAGDLRQASAHYQRALDGWRTAGDQRGVALALAAQGVVHNFLGQSEEAFDAFRRAEQTFGALGDIQGRAVALNGIGQTYEDLNRPDDARDYYLASLALHRRTGKKDFQAVNLLNVAQLYLEQGKTAEATDFFRQCIRLCRQTGKARLLANARRDLASIGGGHAGQETYRKLIPFYKRIGDRQGEAITLNLLGESYRRQGHPAGALRLHERACRLSREGGNRLGEAKSLYAMARARRDAGLYDAALADIRAAIAIVEELRQQVISESSRRSYFASVQEYYGLYIDLLMLAHRSLPSAGLDAQALLVSERARARSLVDVLGLRSAGAGRPADRPLLEQELATRRELKLRSLALERLADDGDGAESRRQALAGEVRELQRQLQFLEAEVRKQSPDYAMFAQPSTLDVQAIQQELGKRHATLLEYFLGERRGYLWVVSGTSLHSYVLPGRRQIEASAREVYRLLTARQPIAGETPASYRHRVAAADRDYARASAALSRTLLGRALPHLQDERLFLVLDGPLYYVPFDALPLSPQVVGADSAGGGRRAAGAPLLLLLRYETSLLPSFATLLGIEKNVGSSPKPEMDVAVFADPVFDDEDPRHERTLDEGRPAPGDGAGAARLPRLLATRDEAQQIGRLVAPGRSLIATGFDANLSAVTSGELQRYRIIHFATHGLLNDEFPEFSGLVFSRVDRQGRPVDGLVQLGDIYALSLSADLVVLSACRTALGKEVSGEGLMSMTRAFFHAGARNVVSTLWQVDDRASSRLVGEFYQKMLEEGLPPSSALRATKASLLRTDRWAAPYYWSAFVLNGGDVPAPRGFRPEPQRSATRK